MENNNSINYFGEIGSINKRELTIDYNGHRLSIPITSIKKVMLFKRKKLLRNYMVFFIISLALIPPIFILTSSLQLILIFLIALFFLITLFIKDFEYIFLIVKDYDFFEIKIESKNIDEAKKIFEIVKELRKKIIIAN